MASSREERQEGKRSLGVLVCGCGGIRRVKCRLEYLTPCLVFLECCSLPFETGSGHADARGPRSRGRGWCIISSFDHSSCTAALSTTKSSDLHQPTSLPDLLVLLSTNKPMALLNVWPRCLSQPSKRPSSSRHRHRALCYPLPIRPTHITLPAPGRLQSPLPPPRLPPTY